jgi:HSP20 family protein
MGNGSKERSVIVRERRLPGLLGWPEDFMERAMRGFFPRRRFVWPLAFREAMWVPEMDVFEREGKTVVRVDLPGIKREDIEVAVEGDMLEIRGRRQEEKEVKEEDYYCAERAVGEFSRAVSLPEGVKAEEIEASCQDGVLEVVVPRPAPAEKASTKIEVK